MEPQKVVVFLRERILGAGQGIAGFGGWVICELVLVRRGPFRAGVTMGTLLWL